MTFVLLVATAFRVGVLAVDGGELHLLERVGNGLNAMGHALLWAGSSRPR